MDEGVHVPVIPFGEVVFNNGAVAPVQIVNAVAKSGMMLLVTVTTNVTFTAH